MFLEITTTRLLKMSFPARQLFLKTLPLKCWPQYLGNYADNIDGTYTYLVTTLMVQNETVYINIYMKLKNIFSNSNRYFAFLIRYVYTLCIYIIYIILYCIYYIYHQSFRYLGIGDNPPTGQKFAHSLRTWNNFFPYQRLVSSPLNEHFHINKPRKTSFSTVLIAPAPLLFQLHTLLYTQVMLISILIHVQYLQNA